MGWIRKAISDYNYQKEKAENERIIAEMLEQIKDSEIVNTIYAEFLKWVEDYLVPQWKENRGKDYHNFSIRVYEYEVSIYEHDPDPYGSPSRCAGILTFNKHGYNDLIDENKREALKRALCLKPGLTPSGYLDRDYWEPIMNQYCQNFKDIF